MTLQSMASIFSITFDYSTKKVSFENLRSSISCEYSARRPSIDYLNYENSSIVTNFSRISSILLGAGSSIWLLESLSERKDLMF